MDYLTFVVGGAGFTGIEFIGELADRIPKLCREFDVDPNLVKIYNVEAAPSALPGFDPELVQYGMEVLRKKGVTFRIGTALKECHPEQIILADGEIIKTTTVIWTGGVRGNQLMEKAGFETTRGRIKVDAYLRVPNHEDVFVIGDCSIVLNDEGKPYPPTAQMALQQADLLAYNLVSSIRASNLRTFKFENKGTVASLGKGEAIGIVFHRKVKGSLASIIKKLIDLRYLYIIGGISLVLRKGYFR